MKVLFVFFLLFSLLSGGCDTTNLTTDPVDDPIPGDGNENGIVDQFENEGTPIKPESNDSNDATTYP